MRYPQNTPKMIIFSRNTNGLLGTTILGNPHIYLKMKIELPQGGYVIVPWRIYILQ